MGRSSGCCPLPQALCMYSHGTVTPVGEDQRLIPGTVGPSGVLGQGLLPLCVLRAQCPGCYPAPNLNCLSPHVTHPHSYSAVEALGEARQPLGAGEDPEVDTLLQGPLCLHRGSCHWAGLRQQWVKLLAHPELCCCPECREQTSA